MLPPKTQNSHDELLNKQLKWAFLLRYSTYMRPSICLRGIYLYVCMISVCLPQYVTTMLENTMEIFAAILYMIYQMGALDWQLGNVNLDGSSPAVLRLAYALCYQCKPRIVWTSSTFGRGLQISDVSNLVGGSATRPFGVVDSIMSCQWFWLKAGNILTLGRHIDVSGRIWPQFRENSRTFLPRINHRLCWTDEEYSLRRCISILYLHSEKILGLWLITLYWTNCRSCRRGEKYSLSSNDSAANNKNNNNM